MEREEKDKIIIDNNNIGKKGRVVHMCAERELVVVVVVGRISKLITTYSSQTQIIINNK